MSDTVPPRPDLREEVRPQLPPATWRALEAIPVGLIAIVVTSIVTAVVARIVVPGASADELRNDPTVFTFANLTQGLSLLGAVVMWVLLVKHAPLSALGLPPRKPLADLGVGVLTGVVLVFAAGFALQIVHAIVDNLAGHTVRNPDQIPTTVTNGMLALNSVFVVVLAPIAEETFFRGFLYRGLRRRLAVWPAALISALIFGLAHFSELRSLLIIPPLIVVGVVLAMVYERQRSLLASVAAHATFNLIGVLVIAFGR